MELPHRGILFKIYFNANNKSTQKNTKGYWRKHIRKLGPLFLLEVIIRGEVIVTIVLCVWCSMYFPKYIRNIIFPTTYKRYIIFLRNMKAKIRETRLLKERNSSWNNYVTWARTHCIFITMIWFQHPLLEKEHSQRVRTGKDKGRKDYTKQVGATS